MYMEEFFGYVNGVKYTSKEAFDNAVKEALTAGGSLTISSHTSVVNDEKVPNENPVIVHEDVNPDELLPKDGNYNGIIPLSTQKRWMFANNREHLLTVVSAYQDDICNEENKLKADVLAYQNEITMHRHEIECIERNILRKKEEIANVNTKKAYFNRLKVIINGNNIKARVEGGVSVPSLFGGFSTSGFRGFLSKSGFWDF